MCSMHKTWRFRRHDTREIPWILGFEVLFPNVRLHDQTSMAILLRDGCSIFTLKVEAISKTLWYMKVSGFETIVIFFDSMSILQATEVADRAAKDVLSKVHLQILDFCVQIFLKPAIYVTFVAGMVG